MKIIRGKNHSIFGVSTFKVKQCSCQFPIPCIFSISVEISLFLELPYSRWYFCFVKKRNKQGKLHVTNKEKIKESSRTFPNGLIFSYPRRAFGKLCEIKQLATVDTRLMPRCEFGCFFQGAQSTVLSLQECCVLPLPSSNTSAVFLCCFPTLPLDLTWLSKL